MRGRSSSSSMEITKNGECLSDENNNQKTHKKQVRRRLHTSKPYQERLLNMAEARREIVTALKFHRASMKQQQSSAAAPADNLDFQKLHDRKSKSRKAQSRHPNSTTTTATATTNSYSSLSWPIPMTPPAPPSYHENQDFVLPSQTLGLTLNYQNFSNLDTNIYHKPMSMYSASSSSSTPSTSSVPGGEWTAGKSISSGGGGLHHAMDDEEMEEIRSLGEQHQIEWNDTINLVTSARWCNFLKSMEIEAGEGDDGFQQFDQIMEFPQWLINANESSCLEQHFDHHFSDAYFQDPALPCMDIGEIEAMDGEWLA